MSDSDPEPRTHRTFGEFQRALKGVVPGPASTLSLDDRFETIVPLHQRRHVWRELQAAGWKLPELQRPTWVVLLCALVIWCLVAVLVLALRTWTALLTLIDLSWAARIVTRSLAVKPPIACETVHEAVLRLNPFRREDYQAGLWPRQELAAKVRLIISEATGIPFAEIHEDTKLADLDC